MASFVPQIKAKPEGKTVAASMVPLNVVNALVKAVEYLSAEGWTPKSNLQHRFLEKFYVEKVNLHLFTEGELRAWADTVAENLNRILEEEGFSLRFDPFNPGEFGVLSILDVTVEWLKEGRALPASRSQSHATVRMEDHATIDDQHVTLFDGLTTPSHPHPIARLPTKSGDVVYMTIAGEEACGFALVEKVDTLRAARLRPGSFSYLLFPMVDFEETKSLDWLVGMETFGGSRNMEVAAAMQQTKFKMNHTGARVKDAVTLTMRLLSFTPDPPPIIIDKPFFLWIERPGLGKPIFYGYLDESVWKDPGSLDM